MDVNEFNEAMDLMFRILPFTIPLIILQIVLLIAALVSLVKKNTDSNQKIVWLLVIVFASTLGSILYFTIGSKMLDNIAAQEPKQR
jgi:membrane protein YqaA with SNARE-associated domain